MLVSPATLCSHSLGPRSTATAGIPDLPPKPQRKRRCAKAWVRKEPDEPGPSCAQIVNVRIDGHEFIFAARRRRASRIHVRFRGGGGQGDRGEPDPKKSPLLHCLPAAGFSSEAIPLDPAILIVCSLSMRRCGWVEIAVRKVAAHDTLGAEAKQQHFFPQFEQADRRFVVGALVAATSTKKKQKVPAQSRLLPGAAHKWRASVTVKSDGTSNYVRPRNTIE